MRKVVFVSCLLIFTLLARNEEKNKEKTDEQRFIVEFL